MGKFRKSQKILRKNKELGKETFSERAVDVPRALRGQSIYRENNNKYLPPGPDKPKLDEHKDEKEPDKMYEDVVGNAKSLPACRKPSKSTTNTPNLPRRQNESRFSRSRSLPHRRIKNFVPFDV